MWDTGAELWLDGVVFFDSRLGGLLSSRNGAVSQGRTETILGIQWKDNKKHECMTSFTVLLVLLVFC